MRSKWASSHVDIQASCAWPFLEGNHFIFHMLSYKLIAWASSTAHFVQSATFQILDKSLWVRNLFYTIFEVMGKLLLQVWHLIFHVIMHCLGTFLLQDKILSLYVFTFEGQYVKFFVHFAFCIVMPGPAVRQVCFAGCRLQVARWNLIVTAKALALGRMYKR